MMDKGTRPYKSFYELPVGQTFRLEFHGLPSPLRYVKISDKLATGEDGIEFDFTASTARKCIVVLNETRNQQNIP